jgi:hypothetical protein
MSGGDMHWGGMQHSGGGRSGNSSTDSTDIAAAHPHMPDMNQNGSSNTSAEQSAPDMSGNPMQMQQEQSEEEEHQTDETQSTATPLNAGTWGILVGCTALLLTGIVISKSYKKH